MSKIGLITTVFLTGIILGIIIELKTIPEPK